MCVAIYPSLRPGRWCLEGLGRLVYEREIRRVGDTPDVVEGDGSSEPPKQPHNSTATIIAVADISVLRLPA
jgi:hypothetical protein